MKKFVLFAASAIALLAACNSNEEVMTSIGEGNPQVCTEFQNDYQY
ncbi:MAG: lipoprotein [Bacteroidaceae bacterium]|nr:lipoprotein [Bacteroidaceae bacterium]